ncbi:UNVERIFIED_CONTAM: amidohydrolase family protein [Microbacterium sp. SLM126]
MLDTHVHVWDPCRLEYPWLKGIDGLHRAMRRQDYRSRATRVVCIEAGCTPAHRLEEVSWIGEMAADWPQLAGIVAAADLRDPRAGAHLDALGHDPLVVGVRHNLQSEPIDRLTDGSLIDGMSALPERGLVFDACVQASQLGALASLARSVPELPIVIDHLGNPPVRASLQSAEGRRWVEAMTVLAELPHTFVKLSGLSPSADRATYEARARDFVAFGVDEFGPSRAMWGSDWPVSSSLGAAESPGAWWMHARAVAGLDDDEWDLVAEGTGSRFYGLAPIPTATTRRADARVPKGERGPA